MCCAPRLCFALALLLAFAVPSHAQEGPGTAVSGTESSDDQSKEHPASQADTKAPIKSVSTVDIVRANLEPAYLAYPFGIAGLPSLIFESNVVAHFFVNQPSWPFAVVLTPKIVVRMFNQYSAPVKTPSYMPRITALFWFDKEIRNEPAFYGSVMLSHHSNGQSGPFFLEDGSFNHDTGSFSTNYLEFSAYATGFRGHWFGWSALSLEWHFDWNQSPELDGRYGLIRAHFATTLLANLPLKGQLNLRLSAILDRFMKTGNHAITRELERFPLSIRYSLSIPGIDLGLYVGYYVGHDYYNIYFDRFVHTLQIGISGGVTPSLIDQD